MWFSRSMHLFQRRGHLLLQAGHGIAVFGGVQSAGQLEHRVQVGLSAHAEFLSDFAKGAQISAHQFAVHGKRGAPAALQAEGDFDVSAMQALLQHAADFHLHRIELDGQAQMQIEKAVVHRFQAQRSR